MNWGLTPSTKLSQFSRLGFDPKRWLIVLFALLCLFYQTEWPVWAALSLPDAATMDCSCRGTESCCCRMQKQQPHDEHASQSTGMQCHLEKPDKPMPQANCILQADDCGHGTPTIAGSMHREPACLRQAAFLVIDRSQPHVQMNYLAFTSALIELPFIPPERDRA